jgi:uncharacterized protein
MLLGFPTALSKMIDMLNYRIVLAFALFFVGTAVAGRPAQIVTPPATALAPDAATTVSGIALDSPWKAKLYAFARAHFKHPAWGWQHSERNYRLATGFAKDDGLAIDADIVFAAAMLHDMAAFAPWNADTKTEHGDIAAEASGAILRDVGFPMVKLAHVQAAERGHMFYSVATEPEAIVLHDADSVDFLGYMGATRMIALTGESAGDVGTALVSLRSFLTAIPPKLITKSAKRLGAERAAETKLLLDRLEAESYGGLR